MVEGQGCRREDAEAGKRGVGVGQFQKGDLCIPDGKTKAIFPGRPVKSADAGPDKEVPERGWSSEVVEGPHGGHIERIGEGISDRDRPVVLTVIVDRQVESFFGAVRGGDIGDDTSGRKAAPLECEKVGEGFQGRARGTGSARAVDLSSPRVVEVPGADERENFPGAVVDDDHGRLVTVEFLQSCEFLPYDFSDFLLQAGIESRMDGLMLMYYQI